MTPEDGRRPDSASVLFFPRWLLKAQAAARLLGALVLLLAAFGCRPQMTPALRIQDGAGRTLALLEAPDGRFIHHYTHTIHRSAVDEYFEIADGKLRAYELRYDTLSVGMPSDAELGYRLEEGRFVLSMDREFDEIPIMVSILPDDGILIDGRMRQFTEWALAEDLLVLSASALPRFLSRREAR